MHNALNFKEIICKDLSQMSDKTFTKSSEISIKACQHRNYLSFNAAFDITNILLISPLFMHRQFHDEVAFLTD